MSKKTRTGKLLFLGILIIGIFLFAGRGTAQAATYETIGSFVEKLMNELTLSGGSDDKASALDAGLITEEELRNWTKTLTRADAAVYLDRADAILHNDTISDELVAEIIEKRISDIDVIPEAKQESVARAYARGLIKGYSNGKYSTDREFRGNKKVSTGVADGWIALLKDTKSRFQISPDGQVIRTTKLPSNAELYPYILESYPNEYYDWEFRYMKATSYYEDPEDKNAMIGVPWMYHPNVAYLKDYTAPKDIFNTNFEYESFDLLAGKEITKYRFKEFIGDTTVNVTALDLITRGLETWVNRTKEYLTLAFSYDYKVIKKGDDWYNSMLALLPGYGNYQSQYDQRELDYYLINANKNQVQLEVDTVAIDGSTLYWYQGHFYLRCYVHYRYNSIKDYSIKDARIFVPSGGSYAQNLKIGEWRDGYFDVQLSDSRSNIVTDLGISSATLSDHFYTEHALDKWDGKGLKIDY